MNINKEVYANVKKNLKEINEWENEQIRLYHQQKGHRSKPCLVDVSASVKDVMEIGTLPVKLHKVGDREYKSAVITLGETGTRNYEMALEIIEAILSPSKINKVVTREDGFAEVITKIPYLTYQKEIIEKKDYDNHTKTAYLGYTVKELMEIPFKIQPWDEGTVFYVAEDANNINPILMQSLFRELGADVLCDVWDFDTIDGEEVRYTKYYTNLPWGCVLDIENTPEEIILERIIDNCMDERYYQLEGSGECDPEFEMNDDNETEWLNIKEDLINDEIEQELKSLKTIDDLREYALNVICMPGYKVCELDKITKPMLLREVIRSRVS